MGTEASVTCGWRCWDWSPGARLHAMTARESRCRVALRRRGRCDAVRHAGLRHLALLLGYPLYRSRLVSRVIPVTGLIGAPPLFLWLVVKGFQRLAVRIA
jgi:hypothetical protein